MITGSPNVTSKFVTDFNESQNGLQSHFHMRNNLYVNLFCVIFCDANI